MKRLIFVLFLSTATVVWGQDKDIIYHQAPNAATAKDNPKKAGQKDYLEHISVGGTGGLQVGYATCIAVSPHAAYHFNEYVCVGIGGSYVFYYDKYSNYSTHVFGASTFAEAHFFRYLGVHAAYEALNYENFVSTIAKPRIWSNHLCLGGGYYQRAGRVAFYCYALYNLSDRPLKETIYSSPLLFKMGFAFFLK